MTDDKKDGDKKDDDGTLHMPYGEISPNDLSTGGVGSGTSSTDTGGLDAAGNELGATSPGGDQGRQEGKRMDAADAGARSAGPQKP